MKLFVFSFLIIITISYEYYTAKRTRYTKEGKKCASSFVINDNTYTDCVMLPTPDNKDNKEEWCYLDSPKKGEQHWGYCEPILDYDYVREEAMKDLMMFDKQKYELSIKISNEIINIRNKLNEYEVNEAKFKSLYEMITSLYNEIKELEEKSNELVILKEQIKQKQDDINDANRIIEQYKREVNSIDDDDNDEIVPTGLKASYFNNDRFEGSPIIEQSTLSSIDFDWTLISPYEGINPDLYSIVFEGYIDIPMTSTYSFIIETKDKVSLMIDNDTINITSNELYLLGGNKYKITIKFIHRFYSHSSLDTTYHTYLILKWKSKEIPLSVISKDYLYASLPFDSIDININENEDGIVISKLYDGTNAFSNSDEYIINDIPDEYIGMTSMKFPIKYKRDKISFTLSHPSIMYFAFITSYPLPFPLSSMAFSYSDTGEFISLLEIDNCTLTAKRSALMKVYQIKLPSGYNSIPLMLNDININGISMLAFITIDHKYHCGGINSSLNKMITQCKASSEYDERYKCMNGFSSLDRNDITYWASNGEGVGAWVKATFNNKYMITKIKYRNKQSINERNSKIKIIFDNGIEKVFAIENNDHVNTFSITPPVISTSIKVIITGVYSQMNNGFAIDVIGTKCINTFEEEVKRNSSDVIYMTCRDKLIDMKDIKVNETYTIECNDDCEYATMYDIYGDNKYSDDSSICKSMTHQLGKNTLKAKLIVDKGDMYYESKERNDIISKNKGYSEFSFYFEKI